jgi:hypothetical protein
MTIDDLLQPPQDIDKKLAVRIKSTNGDRTYLIAEGELKLFMLVSGLKLETKVVSH